MSPLLAATLARAEAADPSIAAYPGVALAPRVGDESPVPSEPRRVSTTRRTGGARRGVFWTLNSGDTPETEAGR